MGSDHFARSYIQKYIGASKGNEQDSDAAGWALIAQQKIEDKSTIKERGKVNEAVHDLLNMKNDTCPQQNIDVDLAYLT